MDDLRRRAIRLAFAKPHLRAHLLPILARGQAELPPGTEVDVGLFWDSTSFYEALDRGDREAVKENAEYEAQGPRYLRTLYQNGAKDIQRLIGARTQCGTGGKSGEARCSIKNISRRSLEKLLGILESGSYGWAKLPAPFMYVGSINFAPGGSWWAGSGEEKDLRAIREYLDDLDDPPRYAAATTGLPEDLIHLITKFNREHHPFVEVALRNVPPKALRSQRAWEDYWGDVGGDVYAEEPIYDEDEYEQDYEMVAQPDVVKRVTRELGLGSLRPDADDLLQLGFTLKALGREVFKRLRTASRTKQGTMFPPKTVPIGYFEVSYDDYGQAEAKKIRDKLRALHGTIKAIESGYSDGHGFELYADLKALQKYLGRYPLPYR